MTDKKLSVPRENQNNRIQNIQEKVRQKEEENNRNNQKPVELNNNRKYIYYGLSVSAITIIGVYMLIKLMSKKSNKKTI